MPNPVVVRITGKVDELRASLGQAAGSVEDFSNRAKKSLESGLSSIANGLGSHFGSGGQSIANGITGKLIPALDAIPAPALLAAAAVLAIGTAAVDMGKKALGEFEGLAEQVRQVQLVSGATTEDASRLLAVFRDLGVETTSGSRGIYMLSKAIEGHAATLEADGVAVARNKSGTTDLYGTLLNVVDAYNKQGDAAARNKIAQDAFGKSGLALLPVLAENRKQLEELANAAARHNQILTPGEEAEAHRLATDQKQLGDAINGVWEKIGAKIAPIADLAVRALTRLAEAGDWATRRLDTLERMVSRIPIVGKALTGSLEDQGVKLKDAAASSTDLANSTEDLAGSMQTATTAIDEAAAASKRFQEANLRSVNAQIAQVDAASSVADAEARVTDDLKAQADQLDVNTGKVETFQDALSKTADAFVSADEAQIRMRDSARSVGDALKGVGSGAEDAAAYMKRFYAGVGAPGDDHADKVKMAVDQAIEQAVQVSDAMAQAGTIPDTAQGRKGAIEQQLNDLKKQYPAVAQQVDEYLARLRKVPNLTTSAVTSNQKLSKSKQDLAKDTADLVGALAKEADLQPDLNSKHAKFLELLQHERDTMPQLRTELQKYLDMFTTDAWTQLTAPMGLFGGWAGFARAFGAGDVQRQDGPPAAATDGIGAGLATVQMFVTQQPGEDGAAFATVVAQKLGWQISKTGRM